MPGVIHLLPESTANQIAAGEVVQRPASVVKELLENAVDAGADVIKLYLKNGGSTLIQVDDNGCGMNAFDARMCWERHATSKISKAEDLYNLSTLGFRGEALASIASVSDIEMKTRSADEEVGVRIALRAGNLTDQESAAVTQGTSIAVKNLFYNIPARKNFLKSMSVETKHVFEEFQRIALAYPEISFEYFNQDKQVIKLRSASLKKRLSDLFNIKEDQLIETNEQTDIVSIQGYIGSPKTAKRTRGLQYLFANGRFIKDAYLNHAILSGYGSLVEEKQYPFYVLYLSVDPAKIDVNIHPTKHEVKLEDGRHVYTLLQSVIKKSLGMHYSMPTDIQLANATHQPTGKSSSFRPTPPDKRFNPFTPPKTKTRTEWEKLDEILQAPLPHVEREIRPQELIDWPTTVNEVGDVFQVDQAFIVTKIKGELCIVHQHRAHTQVLYERYMQSNNIASQQLLFPRTIELSAADFNLYMSLQDEINAMGFDTSEFGKNTLIVNGLPSEISKDDGAAVLQHILDDYKDNHQNLSLSKHDAIRQAAAKNAAIKAGTSLSETEMKKLVSDLLHCKQQSHTATGKSIVVNLTKSKLERFFQ